MGVSASPVGSAEAGDEAWNLPAGAQGRSADESPCDSGSGHRTGCQASGRLFELDLFFL